MNKQNKLFILTVLFMTCIGAVSASSMEDNSIYLDTANLDDGTGGISAGYGYESNRDDALLENNHELYLDDCLRESGYESSRDEVILERGYESSRDSSLAVDSDENPLFDNGDSNEASVTTDSGGIRNISLSDGYNGYCIDMNLHGAEPGQSFAAVDTSVIKSHIYDTPVGEYLKILFYNYYDELSADKDETSEIIWTFTDRYYLDSTNELVLKVLSDYDGGLRVPDHGAVKKLNETHEMTFDFEALISSEESIQNYFGYKVSILKIENSNGTNDSADDEVSDNGTDDEVSDNGTDDEVSDNGTDGGDFDNGTDNGTSETGSLNSSGDSSGGLNEKSKSLGSKRAAARDKKLSISKGRDVSSKATGNPLFVLLLALALIGLMPFKGE